MTTTPQTEAQRLAASISETLDSQDDSYLTCSVTKCLLQQAATELLRLDSLRLELQTQLADYKEACTKAETRADQAEGRAKLLACAWIKATDAVPQESDGEVFVRFSDGSIGTGWATYWHGSSNDFARWTFPDTDEFRMVSEWAKNVPASTGMHWTENEPVRLPASRAGRVYMAGPMTGLPELNFPAFNQEAERLRAEGLQVLNPADHGIVDGADWADYLRHDIAGLSSCERIHLLRGWTKSKGACLEMTIAKALGMTVTYQFDAEMEHNNAHAQDQCNACCGTGRMVRDPDIGTDQECFVCDGTGFLPAQEVEQDDHVSIGRVMAEQWLSAMEGVIDVADRNTEEFDALRKSIIDLALLLHAAPASTQTSEMTVDYVMAIFQKRFPRTRLSNAWRDSAEDIIKALRAKGGK